MTSTILQHDLMRILSITVLFTILLFGCSAPESQENQLTTEVTQRLMASEGGQLLLQSLEAHGGLDAWHNAETSSYIWGFGGGIQSKMVAHNRTRQVYHDILSMGQDIVPEGAQMVWDGDEAWAYPDSAPPGARFMATTGYYFQSIPFILADPGVRYEILAPAILDSVEHYLLRATFDDGVGDAPGDHYTLYIHPETYMVNALRYRSTFGSGRPPIDENMRETLLYYKDYVAVDGLTVPTKFEGFGFMDGQRGDKYYEAASSEHSYTQPFDESRLIMPEGARIDPGPSSE